jgi:formylglycine-generating enzyme required for sulfatase activity
MKEGRSSDRTPPVGSYPKGRSYLGLEDMTGNLGEWTQDYFGFHHPQPDVDPTGPDEGLPLDRTTRVVRGASWAAVDERMAVATYRQGGDRVYGDDQTGFRCVYTPR